MKISPLTMRRKYVKAVHHSRENSAVCLQVEHESFCMRGGRTRNETRRLAHQLSVALARLVENETAEKE